MNREPPALDVAATETVRKEFGRVTRAAVQTGR
jgi:hypothetical protein